MKPLPSKEYLQELLDYDPDTGVFKWKVSRGGKVPGDIAGKHDSYGYRQISVGNKPILAHRMAWLFVFGEWPLGEIDHTNGVRDDNRITNLRVVTRAENMHNASPVRKNNTSGFKGVGWVARLGKWRAGIRLAGVKKHLGYFTSPEEAYEAYAAAKRELHPSWVEV